MRVEQVEVYSDFPNTAVMRHPGRKFPGVLIQGDSLHSWCVSLDAICDGSRGKVGDETFAELNALRNRLWESLTHYKQCLVEHQIAIPFGEQSRF